jgi:DUF971 family protein
MSVPTRISVTAQRDAIHVEYQQDIKFNLPAEYLRVFSPSADMRDHSQGQRILQAGKRHVLIHSMEQCGNYAVQIVFDDGHHSGIFKWQFLYQLGYEQQQNWDAYLRELRLAGQCREPSCQVVKFPN